MFYSVHMLWVIDVFLPVSKFLVIITEAPITLFTISSKFYIVPVKYCAMISSVLAYPGNT